MALTRYKITTVFEVSGFIDADVEAGGWSAVQVRRTEISKFVGRVLDALADADETGHLVLVDSLM
jgi:hypothetical protein